MMAMRKKSFVLYTGIYDINVIAETIGKPFQYFMYVRGSKFDHDSVKIKITVLNEKRSRKLAVKKDRQLNQNCDLYCDGM